MAVSRRSFLAFSLAGVIIGAITVFLHQIYRYLWPKGTKTGGTKASILETSVPEGEAKILDIGGTAAIVIKRKGGKIFVLSAVCSHLGCIVQWQKDEEKLLCPCHAGIYNLDGGVIAGPPPKPLEKLPFTLKDGMVNIG